MPVIAAAISAEAGGRRVLSAAADKVIMWGAATGAALHELEGLHGASGRVLCLAADAEGALVATGGDDGVVGLWRALPPSQCDAMQDVAADALLSVLACVVGGGRGGGAERPPATGAAKAS